MYYVESIDPEFKEREIKEIRLEICSCEEGTSEAMEEKKEDGFYINNYQFTGKPHIVKLTIEGRQLKIYL